MALAGGMYVSDARCSLDNWATRTSLSAGMGLAGMIFSVKNAE